MRFTERERHQLLAVATVTVFFRNLVIDMITRFWRKIVILRWPMPDLRIAQRLAGIANQVEPRCWKRSTCVAVNKAHGRAPILRRKQGIVAPNRRGFNRAERQSMLDEAQAPPSGSGPGQALRAR